MYHTKALLIVGAGLVFCTRVFGQITGDLEIKVSDPSDAVVPNAKVSVQNRATAAHRAVTTDISGFVRIGQLDVGEYEVTVEVSGFAIAKSFSVVESGAVNTVPIRLEIQRQEQQIIVYEGAATINTTDAQLQTTLEASNFTDIPLNGGVLALVGVAPGVIPVAPKNPFIQLGSFNSNGGRGRGNNITLDNATATDISTTGSSGLATLPQDAIEELTIITNNFNAEYGRNSSAQVQLLSKSGSNGFHGRLFEFFRNDKLNARDYFDTTGNPTLTRDNDWGAVVGGPVRRNKIFWFGTYEQHKIRGSSGTVVATVPTTAQLSGPINPTSAALLKQLQVPSSASGSLSGPAPNTTNELAFSGRVDLNLSDDDRLFVRFGTHKIDARSAALTFSTSNLPTNGASNVYRDINATISHTHIFTPSVVNNFLSAFGRSDPSYPALFNFGGPEVIFRDGTSDFGTWSGLPQGKVQNVFQYQDTLSFNRGAHYLKFGGYAERIQANSFFDSRIRGEITFLTMNDFLIGNVFSYTQRFGNSVRGFRVWNPAFFAQDDYRVARQLTFNLGLRVEIANGPTEINGILSNLDLNNHAALGGAGTGPLGAFDLGGSSFKRNRNLGPRFGFAWSPGGDKLVIRGGYGIAYDFIYMNPITNGRFLPPFMYQLSLAATGITGNNNYANLIAGTSDFQQGGRSLVGSFGTTFKNFGVVNPVSQDLKNPQVQQWSLTAERELPWGLVGRVSYVGTKGTYLQRSRPINTIAPGVFTPPQTAQEEAARQATGEFTRVNAGLTGSLTAGSTRIDPRFNSMALLESSANSIYNSVQLWVARRFTRGYGFTVSYTFSKSIDDVSDALGIFGNDSANQQNPFDNRNNRAVSAFDVPQRFVITHHFEPQWAATNKNLLLRSILHGWKFSGIFQAQSGHPITIYSGTRAGLSDPTLLGGGGLVRPNLVGLLNIHLDANPGRGSANPNKVTGSGLAQPLVGHFGNLGRNVLRVNPTIQADWTVGRIFKVTERVSTEFQVQMFNVFNNTTFDNVGGSSSTGTNFTLSGPSTFGYYTATATDQRNTTLPLRLIW